MNDIKQLVRVFPVALASELHQSPFFTLGLLIAHAKTYRDGLLSRQFHFDPITPFRLPDADLLLEKLRNDNVPVVFLLSSYIWNHDQNLAFARMVRQKLPGSLTVIGGPHIPKADKPCRQLLNIHHCLDVAVHGEGEAVLAELLETIMAQYDGVSSDIRWTDLSGVASLTYRQQNLQLVRTPDRKRVPDLDVIPSPYLTGEYEHLQEMPWCVVIETNRGCPFGCTFCDWGGATMSKINRFDLQRVLDEIEYLARRGVERIILADANFGAFERDIVISEKLVEMKRKYGFPATVHYFLAKNSPERVARIVKIFHVENMMMDVVASLQTIDAVTLENIGRKNIKESAYIKLIDNYVDLGLQPETDLLIGLPGQNYQTFEKDLQFAFNRNVYARTFLVSLLPNSPMSDEAYRAKFNIVTDEKNVVVSTYSMDGVERDNILKLRIAYMCFVDEKVLKCIISYLQFEYGVLALDFIHSLMECAKNEAEKYPVIHWMCSRVVRHSDNVGTVTIKWSSEDGWVFNVFPEFLAEVFEWVATRFDIAFDPEERHALEQFQIGMVPQPGIKVGSYDMCLAFDVPAYVEQFQRGVPVAGEQREGAANINALREFKRETRLHFPVQPQMKKKGFSYFKDSNQPGWPMKYESFPLMQAKL